MTGPGFLLFQRDDCHLCDLALEVLAAAGVPDFDSVFVDGQARLEEQYGTRVPVWRDELNDRELDWPFDVEELRAFMDGSR